MHYRFMRKKNGLSIECHGMLGNEKICKCLIQINDSHEIWSISSWFTEEGYGNKGYGRQTLMRLLQYVFNMYGMPDQIQYIWNGANEYVLNWMEEHFDAICTCPIAVQKTQADDDWDSHIYNLNLDKVMDYFQFGKAQQD